MRLTGRAKSLWGGIGFLICLSACASRRQDQPQIDELISRSIGGNINDVIAAAGPPQRLMRAPGERGNIYIWADEHARLVTGYSSSRISGYASISHGGNRIEGEVPPETELSPAQLQGWTTYAMFWADEGGVIYRWAWKGLGSDPDARGHGGGPLEVAHGMPATVRIDPTRVRATLVTDLGDITIRFFPDRAPYHVRNFIDLSTAHVYDGVLFHRVIPGFMIQTGDPITRNPQCPRELMGTGAYSVAQGGAEEGFLFNFVNVLQPDGRTKPAIIRNVKAEFNDVSHKRGIVSMGRSSDPNSASSQFFIVVKDSTFLDHQYTAFGEVTTGMDVVDRIAVLPRDSRDNPIAPLHLKRVILEAS
jgi:peptidyl-prolyl cis-trans isomerase B (cyclophilin B)